MQSHVHKSFIELFFHFQPTVHFTVTDRFGDSKINASKFFEIHVSARGPGDTRVESKLQYMHHSIDKYRWPSIYEI